jgi:uncharacterized protein (TIGR02246 family)
MTILDSKESHSAYLAYARSGDLDGLMTRFSETAVLIDAERNRLVGRDAIKAYFSGFVPLLQELEFDLIDVVEHGDLALERLRHRSILKLPDGQTLEATGTSSVVLERQADGNWLIVVDDPGE